MPPAPSPETAPSIGVDTTDAATTSFGATTVGQNLSVTATGAVIDTGKLAVSGTTGISSAGQTVTLDDAANDFTGAVTVTGGATTLNDANDLTVTVTTSGATALTAGGALTLDGTVSGATSDLTTVASATSFGATDGRLRGWVPRVIDTTRQDRTASLGISNDASSSRLSSPDLLSPDCLPRRSGSFTNTTKTKKRVATPGLM